MSKSGTKLVCGVGHNNAQFTVQPTVNGRREVVPSYNSWHHMLKRVYSKRELLRNPTYKQCSVDENWLEYMNFHQWYIDQYKEPGWQLDKDLLFPGNKTYCEGRCIFIPKALNIFTTDHHSARGAYLLGVSWHKSSNKYYASCSNPFTGKLEYLGLHKSELKAHLTWKHRKHELACRYAEEVHDPRLAKALRERYAPN